MSLQRGTKLGLLGIAFAIALVFAPSDSRPAYAGAIVGDDEDITVTGCVVRGNGDGKGFLLTNVLPASIDMHTRAEAQGRATAGTSGALPGASSVIYWLDDLEDDDNLAEYAGRRVEVRGEIEGDIDRGEMEIERDGDWVEIDIKSDGKKVETRLPWASVMPNDGTGGAVGTSGTLKEGKEIELNINVRKIDVKDVRVIAGTCQ